MSFLDGDDVVRKVQRELKEADIQESCIRWLRETYKGECYARKFSSPQNRSVPDYVCLVRGRIFFVEFKRPGRKPTEQQHAEFCKIAIAGGVAMCITSLAQFKTSLSALIE